MDSTKYVGIDVHKETISIAVVDSTGQLVKESILETPRLGNLWVTGGFSAEVD